MHRPKPTGNPGVNTAFLTCDPGIGGIAPAPLPFDIKTSSSVFSDWGTSFPRPRSLPAEFERG